MKKTAHIVVMNRVEAYDKRMLQQIFYMLKQVRTDYPNFSQWYNITVRNGLMDGTRQIWLAVSISGEIAGVLILKKNTEERKICTLYVQDCFRGQGIGTQMMKTAIQYLGTDTPLATVSSQHLHEYWALLEHFNFCLCRVYPDYYRSGVDEYAFNGELSFPRLMQICNE